MARKKYQISTSKEKLMTKHLDWMKARVKERTSWDGAACIVLGLIMLGFISISAALAQWVAMVGIAWGGWTIWKSE